MCGTEIPQEKRDKIQNTWLISLYVLTSILVTALLFTLVRLVLYTKLTALSVLTTFMIVANIGYLCWAYFFVQAAPYYGSNWKKESSWFFASTPLILFYWILSFLYLQLAIKLQRVAENKPPSEVGRSFSFIYFGGLLLIIILEIVDCLLYVYVPKPYKSANILYYILAGILAICVGILFDSLRRVSNVCKMYKAMSIDQKFMKTNVIFCILLLVFCGCLGIPHSKGQCFAVSAYFLYSFFTAIT